MISHTRAAVGEVAQHARVGSRVDGLYEHAALREGLAISGIEHEPDPCADVVRADPDAGYGPRRQVGGQLAPGVQGIEEPMLRVEAHEQPEGADDAALDVTTRVVADPLDPVVEAAIAHAAGVHRCRIAQAKIRLARPVLQGEREMEAPPVEHAGKPRVERQVP